MGTGRGGWDAALLYWIKIANMLQEIAVSGMAKTEWKVVRDV